MAVRGVDDQKVDAGIDQPLGPLEAVIAHAGGRSHAQPALRILRRARIDWLFSMSLTVIRPNAMAAVIDDQQLLDAVMVESRLASDWSTVSLTVTRFSRVISS